jgi:hypothetical protein
VSDHLSREWEPGQHFGVYAPTGHGKSVLTVRGLVPRWRWVLTFDVKGDDPELRRAGRRVRRFPSPWELAKEELGGTNPEHRYRLHPGGMGPRAQSAFDDAFRQIWRLGARRRARGAWTINIDEARILSDNLEMKRHIQTVLVLGRSKGITTIVGSQAARYLPSEAYDQPRWFALGPWRDKRTIDRFAEIGGDTDMIRATLPTLVHDRRRREFLILGPEDYAAITTWSPR